MPFSFSTAGRDACKNGLICKVMLVWLLGLLLQACSKAPEAPIATAPAHASSVDWIKPIGDDMTPIFAKAKAENKPVFLYWGAVWCPPCNQIKATVFNRQDFIDRSKLFVAVYIDGDTPGAQKLGTRFKVRGYPSMILFKPDGTELTRLPGEVDAAMYMQVLGLGLGAGSSVKDSLALALGPDSAALTPDAWRLLAYYAWEQDEAQLVPANERAALLHKLALASPSSQPALGARLALKSIVAAALEKTPLPNAPGALSRVQQMMREPSLVKENFDVLVNYAPLMLNALAPAGSSQRSALISTLDEILTKFAVDNSLYQGDRLSALQTRLALARLDLPKGQEPTLSTPLVTQLREAGALADQNTSSTYERQAIIPLVADMWSDAGLLDESDALLKAELTKALSPYYHMLVLAGNAKKRGDKVSALSWSERSWKEAKGSATRLQWGGGHVNRLIELSPQDATRIDLAASAVLSELEAIPETFYERNRRGLEKMGQRLLAWNANGQHAEVIKKLSKQLDAVCLQLPEQDGTRGACTAVFKPRQPKPT